MRLGFWEILVVLAIVLLLFGPSKLPQLGSSLGSAIKNFKRGFSDEEQEPKEAEKSQTVLSSGKTEHASVTGSKVASKD